MLRSLVGSEMCIRDRENTCHDPDIAFSKVLNLNVAKVKSLHSFKNCLTIQCAIFPNGKTKKPLNGSINATKLDSTFLIPLMLRTDFLDISHEDGSCHLNHPKKCCIACNHTNSQGKCTGCQKKKSECDNLSKICCNNCKRCISCINQKFGAFYKAAMIQNTPPDSYQDCSIYKVKAILEDVLHFRNLFHLTAEKANEFISDQARRLEDFPNIQTAEELLLHMNIMCSTLFSLVKKNEHFKQQVESSEVEKVQKTIECIFVNDSIVDQMLNNDFLKTTQEKFNFFDEEISIITKNFPEIEKRFCKIEKKQAEYEKKQNDMAKEFQEFKDEKKYNLDGRS